MKDFKGVSSLKTSFVNLIQPRIKKTQSNLASSYQKLVEKVLEERQESGEAIQQSPVWIKSTTLGLIGTAVFGISWLALAKTDEVVSVTGKLEPLGLVQNIQMP